MPGVDVHDVIQAHRRHLIETMQRYTHLKAGVAEQDVGWLLVIDAEIFRFEGRCGGWTRPTPAWSGPRHRVD